MTRIAGCDCLYCRGEGGRRLVLVSYEIADAAGLVEAARKAKVAIRPEDQVFVVEGVRAVACVRVIRRRFARLCGCWVDPAARGRGIGEMLVRHRIAFVENHLSAEMVDTFAFRKALFLRLGFEERRGFKLGTTMLTRRIDRGRGE